MQFSNGTGVGFRIIRAARLSHDRDVSCRELEHDARINGPGLTAQRQQLARIRMALQARKPLLFMCVLQKADRIEHQHDRWLLSRLGRSRSHVYLPHVAVLLRYVDIRLIGLTEMDTSVYTYQEV